jgi:hypothetical protein
MLNNEIRKKKQEKKRHQLVITFKIRDPGH